MVVTISKTEVQIIGEPDIIFEDNNLVNTLAAVTDKEEGWEYNVDIYMPVTKRYNSIIMTRNGNMLSVDLTRQMLPTDGRYICQFRGQKDEAVYHTEKFDLWVKDSIDMNEAYNPMPAEFYQLETQMKEQVAQVEEMIKDFALPIASTDTLGGVKIGEGISITEDGTISASSGEGDFKADGSVPMAGNLNLNENSVTNVKAIETTTGKISFDEQMTIGDASEASTIAITDNMVDINANVVRIKGNQVDLGLSIDFLQCVIPRQDSGENIFNMNSNSFNIEIADTSFSVGSGYVSSSVPIIYSEAPTEDNQLTNKKYVDQEVATISGEVTTLNTKVDTLNTDYNTTKTTVQSQGGQIDSLSGEVDILKAKQAALVADATSADDIVQQFNALLASLKTAGLMAEA